jgi:small-conductance mechanosensitive channel
MAGLSYIPAAMLIVALVAIAATRSRSMRIKIGCEASLLLMIGATLLFLGASPLSVDARLGLTYEGSWLRALAVVWWLVAARLAATLTAFGLGRDARSRQARLFSDLLAGAIYLTAILIILNSVLNLPVKGLLATSGVIAIVLGLALQNTLADLFSGIAVGLEQPFHVGDRITIADHAEGIVVEMNWRSIRIQTDGEDVATIPNSIVARSQIINRSVPTERRAASVDITTLSNARAENLLELVRQAIMLCPDLLTEPAPSIALKRLGARTMTIGVTYFVSSTKALTAARSQVLRQGRRLFRHAGITDGHVETTSELLRNLALFSMLNAEQLEQLADSVIDHVLQQDTILMEQGSFGASLFVVRAGIFEISHRHDNGIVQIFGRIGPGEYLGEISMMSGDARHVSVTALTQAAVVELPRAALEELLKDDKGLGLAMEQSVQRGLALLDRDSAARICQPLDKGGSVLGRIRHFLGLG